MKKSFCTALATVLLASALVGCSSDSDYIELTKEESKDTAQETFVEEKKGHFSSYEEIIKLYSTVAEHSISYSNEKAIKGEYEKSFDFQNDTERDWYHSVFTATVTRRPDYKFQYGYSVGDINGDGVDELLLLSESYGLYAIFTLCNGSPVLLDSFGNRYYGYIGEDGLIYTSMGSGVGYSEHSVYKISESCDSLELVLQIGADGYIEGTGELYYTVENGEKVDIGTDEYNSIYNSKFLKNNEPPFTKNNAGVKFLSIVKSRNIFADTIELYYDMITLSRYSRSEFNSLTCPDGVDEQYWYSIYELTVNHGSKDTGFYIKDINNDGTDELIFLNSNYSVQAIYSYADGAVKCSKRSFDTTENIGAIDNNGVIYEKGYGKGSAWYEKMERLSSNGELEVISHYGIRNLDPINYENPEYFIYENGVYKTSTEQEISALRKEFRKYADPLTSFWFDITKSHLGFVSLAELKKSENAVTANKLAHVQLMAALAGSITVTDADDGIRRNIAYCPTYYGQVWTYDANAYAFMDFDGDGIDELVLRTMGDYILHYNPDKDTVYAKFLTPRSGYVFYANGDIAHNYQSTVRYKINSFDDFGNFELQEIDCSNIIVSNAKPIWTPVTISEPEGKG